MKKIPKNKQASEGAERRQGASLLLADTVCSVLGGRINAEHTLRDLAINGNDVMKMGFKGGNRSAWHYSPAWMPFWEKEYRMNESEVTPKSWTIF